MRATLAVAGRSRAALLVRPATRAVGATGASGAEANSDSDDAARREALRRFGIDPDAHQKEQQQKEKQQQATANATSSGKAPTSGVNPDVSAAWADYVQYMSHQRDRGWKD